MSSATSHSYGSAWRQFSEEKHTASTQYSIDLTGEATDEASFRASFEKLCRKLKERRYSYLLAKLRFHHINHLASNVDMIEQLPPADNWSVLVWSSALIAIKAASEASINLHDIVDLFGSLNEAVPQFSTDAFTFANHASLQEPLHQLVTIYARTLWYITWSIRSEVNVGIHDQYKNIEKCIDEAAHGFRKEDDKFKALLEQVRRQVDDAPPSTQNSFSYFKSSSHEDTARFVVSDYLGSGSEGQVHRVIEATTGTVYARKQVRSQGPYATPSRTEEQVRNEVTVMQRLRHQHIATILFWTREGDVFNLYMSPCADANLRNYLDACCKQNFDDKLMRPVIAWFGCLTDALAHAHIMNVMHRDIKPSNILIKDNEIYLTDFGEAKDFSLPTKSPTNDYMEFGTPVYRAPEVTPGMSSSLLLPPDIFSLGCVFSEMLTVLCRRSLQEYQTYRHNPSSDCPLAFRSSLTKVRKWLNNLENHPKFDVLVYLIKSMLAEEPQDRHTAQQLWDNVFNSQKNLGFYCKNH